MAPTLEEITEQTKQSRRLIIADDYELTLQWIRSDTGRFCNGNEVVQASEESCWMGLRLLHRKRPGRSSGYYNGPQSLLTLIDSAFESAKRASPDPWFRFPLWKTGRIKASGSAFAMGSEFPEFQSHFSKFLGERNFDLEENYENCFIRTLLHRKTEKLMLSSQRQIQAAQFALLSSEEAGGNFRQERASSLKEDQTPNWIRQFVSRAGAEFGTEIFEAAESCPVIFGPMAATEILKRLSAWFGADNVQAGKSPLAGAQGTKVFSDLVSIVDDATLAGGIHTAPFDMEGCLTQRTSLIECGTVADFLHDSYTATRENRVSTGNSLRLPRHHLPSIQPSNLYLVPSEKETGGLEVLVEKGILIDSFDPIDRVEGAPIGEYHLVGSGWRILGGKKDHRLSGIRASVNLSSLLSRVVVVGDDLEFFAGAGSPSLLVDEVRLGTS